MHISRIGGNAAISKAQVLALGPTLFLDADSISGADGSTVGTWSDESGNAAHFKQTNDTNKPLLKKTVNGISGHNVVRFDGVDNYLLCDKAMSAIVAAAADTFWIVFNIDYISYDYADMYYNENAISCVYWGLCFRTSTRANAYIYDGSAWKSVAKVVSTDTPYIARSRRSSGTIYLKINGDSEGSATGGTCSDLSGAPYLAVGSSYTKIDIAEIIAFNSALTAAKMAIVDRYLRVKYLTY